MSVLEIQMNMLMLLLLPSTVLAWRLPMASTTNHHRRYNSAVTVMGAPRNPALDDLPDDDDLT